MQIIQKKLELCTRGAKCNCDHSAEKHFAKSQNVFCSKSGNFKKNVYPPGILFSSKQAIVYIGRRQFGQPCRNFSAKSPKSFVD